MLSLMRGFAHQVILKLTILLLPLTSMACKVRRGCTGLKSQFYAKILKNAIFHVPEVACKVLSLPRQNFAMV